MVALTLVGRKPVLKKVAREETTSSPTIDQADLKNPEERPSGPGALFGFRFQIALDKSSSDGTESKANL